MILFNLFPYKIVTKPTTKSKPPPPRPSKPPTIPVNDTIQHEAPKAPVVVEERSAPPIDLLNLSFPSQPEPPTTRALPKEPSFDLLGGFESSEPQNVAVTPDLLSDSRPKASALDDIFGAFAQPSSNGSSSVNVNNSGLNFTSTSTSTSNVNFDPFGFVASGPSFMSGSNLLQPNKDTSPTQQQPQQQQQPAKSSEQNGKDPFADMSFLASGLNLNWGDKSKATSATTTPINNNNSSSVKSPQSTQFSSPTHQFGGFGQPTVNTATQARSPMDSQQRPDYSRSHFEPKGKPSDPNTPNQSAGGGDIFADILGQQGYNFATRPQNANRSINAMRKEELVKDMDPDKLRIMEWVSETQIQLEVN